MGTSTSARFFCLLPVPKHISQRTAVIVPLAHGQLVCCPRETIPDGHPALRSADCWKTPVILGGFWCFGSWWNHCISYRTHATETGEVAEPFPILQHSRCSPASLDKHTPSLRLSTHHFLPSRAVLAFQPQKTKTFKNALPRHSLASRALARCQGRS